MGFLVFKSIESMLLDLILLLAAVTPVRAQLYNRVHILECASSMTFDVILTDTTPVGLVAVNLTDTSGQERCSINVQVTVNTEQQLKLDVFSGEDHFLSDNRTDCGVSVTESGGVISNLAICRRSRDQTGKRRASYYPPGKTANITIEMVDGEFANGLQVQLMAEAYSRSRSGNCFLCGSADNVCIHGDLTCDGVDNCPDGEDESFDYTRDKSCTLECDDGALVIEGNRICDGIVDCVDGKDEGKRTCVAKPWSSLSVLDIVVAIASLVLLVLAFAFCMWYYKHPPAIQKYKKKHKARQRRLMKIEQMKSLAKETEADDQEQRQEESCLDDAEDHALQPSTSTKDQVNEGATQAYL